MKVYVNGKEINGDRGLRYAVASAIFEALKSDAEAAKSQVNDDEDEYICPPDVECSSKCCEKCNLECDERYYSGKHEQDMEPASKHEQDMTPVSADEVLGLAKKNWMECHNSGLMNDDDLEFGDVEGWARCEGKEYEAPFIEVAMFRPPYTKIEVDDDVDTHVVSVKNVDGEEKYSRWAGFALAYLKAMLGDADFYDLMNTYCK